MYPHKGLAEGAGHTEERQCEDQVEAETGVGWPQAEDCRQPAGAGRGRESIPSRNLQREGSPADTLFPTSGLQHHERLHAFLLF